MIKKKLNELISDAPKWSPLEVYDENLAVVEELNLKHFVTMIGGKTTVVNEVHDPAMERNILTYSSPTDFKNYYSNRFPFKLSCLSLFPKIQTFS